MKVTGSVFEIIYKIDDNPNAIAVSDDCEDEESLVYVYRIPFCHLAKKHGLDLEEYLENGNEINILAHECPTAKEEGQKPAKLMVSYYFRPILKPKRFRLMSTAKKGAVAERRSKNSFF